MDTSISLMSFGPNIASNLGSISGIKFNRVHLDYCENYDLKKAIKVIVNAGLFPDVHIVAADPTPAINEILSQTRLPTPTFVQLEPLDKAGELFWEHNNIQPAIMVSSNIHFYENIIQQAEYILIMATTPGVSGGVFDEKTFDVIRIVKAINSNIRIYVDGGVNDKNFERLRLLGVHTAVIGSYLSDLTNSMKRQGSLLCDLDIRLPLLSLSEPIENLPCTQTLDLREVLKIMLSYGQNFIFHIGDDLSIKGLLTDGDIKRFLVGSDAYQSISSTVIAPNSKPISLPDTARLSHLIEKGLLDLRYGAIPLRSKDGNMRNAIPIRKLI